MKHNTSERLRLFPTWIVLYFFVPYVCALISVNTCSSETCCLSSSCELGLFLLHSHSLLLMIKTHRNKEANGWSSFVIIVEVKHVTCYMKINICLALDFSSHVVSSHTVREHSLPFPLHLHFRHWVGVCSKTQCLKLARVGNWASFGFFFCSSPKCNKN